MTDAPKPVLRELRPLGTLQSPEGQRAFQTYLPSVMRRHPGTVNAMGMGIRDVRHLPPSYLWAGRTSVDTFYGTSGKPQRPSGTTGGDTMANYYDCEEKA